MRKIHKVKDDNKTLCGKKRGINLLMTTLKSTDVDCILCKRVMRKK